MKCGTIPGHDNNTSGDAWYAPLITYDMVKWFWETYGFKSDNWANMGYEDWPNPDLPLLRTFNACYCLEYSAEDYMNDGYFIPLASFPFVLPNRFLNWAGRYVRDNNAEDLRSECYNSSAYATTWWGAWDDRIELYKSFYYDLSVVERAAVLVHEARHMDTGYEHPNGNQDGRWEDEGPYNWQAHYLLDFKDYAVNTTSAMKTMACQKAKIIMDTKFEKKLDFYVWCEGDGAS